METKQAPSCVNDAQSLHALVNEMKSMLSSPVLDNGAVLVGVLPKHRCCAGSCHSVGSRDGKDGGVESQEEKKHNLVESQEERKHNLDGVEPVGGVEPQGNKHSLEGVWEGGLYNKTPDMILVHTVQDKPGYLFGISLIGNKYIPAKQVMFWLKSGDGMFKDTLEGKARIYRPEGTYWHEVKLSWRSNDAFDILLFNSSITQFTRLQTAEASKMNVS